MSESKFNLQSSGLVHTPGMIRFWKQQWSENAKGRRLAALTMHWSFIGVPLHAVMDVLSGRQQVEIDHDAGTVSFTWEKPLAELGTYYREMGA